MSTTLTPAALAIAAALFDSLWEGLLVVGAVWLGLRCLPKLGAATRYAIWLCTLAALVLIPVFSVALSPQPADPVLAAAQAKADVSMHAEAPVARPRIDTARLSPEPTAIASESAPAAPLAVRKSRITIPQSAALAAAFIWLLVACARGLRLVLNFREIAAIRRDAWLWSSAYDYPVFLSHRVHVPIAIGFSRAAIVLPASLVERLCANAVETIVIHEVAHLRRHDVWTNALARITEAFVALNPAAWFVMRRLSVEREVACDDWVVARTGAGDAFAQTLLDMASRAEARVPIAAPSAIGSRHSIVVRIERLLDSRPRHLRLSLSALGGSLMVLALIALLMQSISPVLAYAPNPSTLALGPTTGQGAGTCPVPNRTVRMTSFMGMKRLGTQPYAVELPEASNVVARFGAANVTTFDLTVDATGRPRKVVVLSAPRYPGMVEHVVRTVMADTYDPALRDCVPVAATVRSGLFFGKPHANSYSIVTPVYPNGWRAGHKSACKVPTLQHTGVPAFPASMEDMSVTATYSTSVRVHVDAAGAVTSAAVVTPSGQPNFDNALLAAARQATYPLTESTGFKQARPAGVSIAWNATHGSDTYVNCNPLPTDYVWNTTFGRVMPIGVPGMPFTLEVPLPQR